MNSKGMDYSSFAEHSEVYKVGKQYYTATANFVTNQIFIKWDHGALKFPMADYEKFNGNMESFVAAKVGAR